MVLELRRYNIWQRRKSKHRLNRIAGRAQTEAKKRITFVIARFSTLGGQLVRGNAVITLLDNIRVNMDGYTLTEQMRRARRHNRLTATEQALFYELVAVCNSEGWQDVYSCSNIELCCALNIDEKTLVRARLSLINAGLVYYKSGKSRRVVGLYSFTKEFKEVKPKIKGKTTTGNNTVVSPAQTTVKKPTDQPTDAPVGTPANAPVDEPAQTPDSYKHKTEIETKLKELSLSLNDLSFVSSDFMDVFLLWLEYKKDRKEKYQSLKSLKICYDRLVKLSNCNSGIAMEIVNEAMALNYKGFFELKSKNKNGNKKQTDNDDRTGVVIRETLF